MESLSDRISRQIVDHIRAEGLTHGDHLPTQALADRFDVSRAPVAAALARLAANGILYRERHRGYFVAKAPDPMPAAENREEDPLYAAIVEARLAGSLPDRLSENEMMRRLGATRARVQRVLNRIADEGWVDRLPGKGWRFLPTLATLDAYEQAYQFRATIETQALLQPGYRFIPGEMERLRAGQRAMLGGAILSLPRNRLFEINVDFHETLVGWSGNRFFVDAVRRINRLRRLIEFRATADRGRLEQQCREHLALLDLIERGDLELAADFLRGHVAHALALKARLVE